MRSDLALISMMVWGALEAASTAIANQCANASSKYDWTEKLPPAISSALADYDRWYFVVLVTLCLEVAAISLTSL